MKIVTVAEMTRIERAADAAGHRYAAMMELAGRAVAAAILRHMAPWDTPGLALVLAGPGNNGGDGLVAARYLRQWDPRRAIHIYCWKRAPDGDANYAAAQQLGIPITHVENDPELVALRELARQADVVVDGLLGTGVARPISGSLGELLAAIGEERAARRGHRPADGLHAPPGPSADAAAAVDALTAAGDFRFLAALPLPHAGSPQVVAVDCPSGLNCDSGALDPAAVPADLTVTFAYPKLGHFVVDGPVACGRLEVAGIGADPELAAGVQLELATPARMQRLLPPRPLNAHKGAFGKALVVAGSTSYSGAAYLACTAAYRAGAGLVTAGVVQSIHGALAAAAAETTWLLLPERHGALAAAAAPVVLETLPGYSALLVGPGLTQEDEAVRFVGALLKARDALASAPLVLDADALNALALADDWQEMLPPRTILTPHPGEMARLCRCTIAAVQADRIGLARRRAADWNAVVLLKGANTVVAAPDGYATVLPFANPALATAGSGDVLAGVIVGLLCQGLAPYQAATLGGYLHGLAGELARRDLGDAGVLAGDLAARLPLAIRQLRAA